MWVCVKKTDVTTFVILNVFISNCYLITNFFLSNCKWLKLLLFCKTCKHLLPNTVKNIARNRLFVSSQDLEKLVHAFITSRVDYCNGLLTGLPKKTIRQLQLIQNAADRILTRNRKSEHITPVLGSLHCLQLHLGLILKYLYSFINLSMAYIADMLNKYKPYRPPRSLGSSHLEIPRVHTKQGESLL